MLTNPAYIYIITFLLAFLLYPLGWSSLYPSLNIMLIMFFAVTFIFSFFLGQFIKYNKDSEFIKIKDSGNVKNKVIFLIGLTTLQILLDPQVPLLNVFLYSYSGHGAYGFPVLHPFILTYSSFVSVYIFHLFISGRNKKFLFYFFVSSIPPLLFYSRGTFMVTLIACIFIILLSYKGKWSAKKIIIIMVLLLVVMFVFGFLGDARTGGSSAGILYSGGATEKFISNPIPNEYFWSYIYITSPLANFNYNVSEQNFIRTIKSDAIASFIIGDFIPDVISNRVLSALNLESGVGSSLRVHNDLTVSTIYMRPYYTLGWLGPLFTYMYMVIFILLSLKLLKKSNPYYVTGICFLNTIIGLNFFTNMLGQTSVFAPLVYSILFGIFTKRRVRWR